MKIGVISPRRYSGATTVSVLLGAAIAQTQASTVCLTAIGDTGYMRSLLGLSETKPDPTRSLTQIVRMLDSKLLKADELEEYCVQAGVNLSFLDSVDASLSEDEREAVLLHVFENVKTDYVICDIPTDLNDSVAQAVLKECGIIIMVILPNASVLETAKEWLASELIPKNAVVMPLVNNYQPEIASVSELASALGVKVRELCKLHQNPYVAGVAWKRRVDSIIPWIMNKDPRVLELHTDLRECLQFLCSAGGKRLRWGK